MGSLQFAGSVLSQDIRELNLLGRVLHSAVGDFQLAESCSASSYLGIPICKILFWVATANLYLQGLVLLHMRKRLPSSGETGGHGTSSNTHFTKYLQAASRGNIVLAPSPNGEALRLPQHSLRAAGTASGLSQSSEADLLCMHRQNPCGF